MHKLKKDFGLLVFPLTRPLSIDTSQHEVFRVLNETLSCRCVYCRLDDTNGQLQRVVLKGHCVQFGDNGSLCRYTNIGRFLLVLMLEIQTPMADIHIHHSRNKRKKMGRHATSCVSCHRRKQKVCAKLNDLIHPFLNITATCRKSEIGLADLNRSQLALDYVFHGVCGLPIRFELR